MTKVMFVGAGPGDAELITVKGSRLLQAADVIIYAGSLVNPALLAYARPETVVHNSAEMTLSEVLAVMEQAVKNGKQVVRLHTGDPSIYGAIQEQMDALDTLGIDYEVVPGVSSFLASAAALRQELTLPGVTQTIIVTRLEGRTPVPEAEKLTALAAHGATMCVFLSVHMLDEVAQQLQAGGFTPDTPVAIVEKASWPEQQIVRGTLADIAAKAQEAGISRTAMIIVSRCLTGGYELSQLYSPQFSHMFREASV